MKNDFNYNTDFKKAGIFDVDECLYFLDTLTQVKLKKSWEIVNFFRQKYLNVIWNESEFFQWKNDIYWLSWEGYFWTFQYYFRDSELIKCVEKALAENWLWPAFPEYLDHLYNWHKVYKVSAWWYSKDAYRQTDRLVVDRYFMNNPSIRDQFIQNILLQNPTISGSLSNEQIRDKYINLQLWFWVTWFEFAREHNNGKMQINVPEWKKKAFNLCLEDCRKDTFENKATEAVFYDNDSKNITAFKQYIHSVFSNAPDFHFWAALVSGKDSIKKEFLTNKNKVLWYINPYKKEDHKKIMNWYKELITYCDANGLNDLKRTLKSYYVWLEQAYWLIEMVPWNPLIQYAKSLENYRNHIKNIKKWL